MRAVFLLGNFRSHPEEGIEESTIQITQVIR